MSDMEMPERLSPQSEFVRWAIFDSPDWPDAVAWFRQFLTDEVWSLKYDIDTNPAWKRQYLGHISKETIHRVADFVETWMNWGLTMADEGISLEEPRLHDTPNTR